MQKVEKVTTKKVILRTTTTLPRTTSTLPKPTVRISGLPTKQAAVLRTTELKFTQVMSSETIFSTVSPKLSNVPSSTVISESNHAKDHTEIESDLNEERVTRSLTNIDVNVSASRESRKPRPTKWFQNIWHIEILAIMGSGWFLAIAFMMCGLSVCICQCRLRRKLTARVLHAESERKEILRAYQKLESENTGWLFRMVTARSISDLRQISTHSCQAQTVRPTMPTTPKPFLMPKPNLGLVPKRGILKISPSQPQPSSSLGRYIKPNQGVRAKEVKRRSSFEIPLDRLGEGPQLNQVRFAKDLTTQIVYAMEEGCVLDTDSIYSNLINQGASTAIDGDQQSGNDVTNL